MLVYPSRHCPATQTTVGEDCAAARHTCSADGLAVEETQYSPKDAPKRNEVMKMLDNMSSRLVVVGGKGGRAGSRVGAARLKRMAGVQEIPMVALLFAGMDGVG